MRKEIYRNTKEYVKGSFGGILFSLITIVVFILISESILNTIMPTSKFESKEAEEAYLEEMATRIEKAENLESILSIDNLPESVMDSSKSYLSATYEKPYSLSFIKRYISGVISFILSGALNIGILNFIREKKINYYKNFSVDILFQTLGMYWKELLVVSCLMGLIGSIFSLIPYFGFILRIIFNLLMTFIVFVIPDNPDLEIFQLFGQSAKKTSGNILNIILISLHYYWLPILIGMGGIVVLFAMLESNTGMGILISLIAQIISIVMIIRGSVLAEVGLATLYDKLTPEYYEGKEEVF